MLISIFVPGHRSDIIILFIFVIFVLPSVVNQGYYYAYKNHDDEYILKLAQIVGGWGLGWVRGLSAPNVGQVPPVQNLVLIFIFFVTKYVYFLKP